MLAALQDAGIPCTEHDAPQTLLLALQGAIIAAATADPWAFDRRRLDDLMRRWEELSAEIDGQESATP